MKILNGTSLAKEWEARLLATKPKKVGDLVGVLIGNDPASILYLDLKGKMAKRLGIGFRLHKLPAGASKKKVVELIESLNSDKGVGGIIVQLPLPAKFSADEIVNLVAEEKDVDGLSDATIQKGAVLPATAAGIVAMLNHYKIDVRDKDVVLIGFSRLLNVPLSLYMARSGAKVTVLQESTKDRALLKKADIIVTAAGVRNLIKGADVKMGVVVIDAGIVKEGKKVYGDVHYESVAKKASAITPVPGGVGPMTLVGLLSNLINMSKMGSGK